MTIIDVPQRTPEWYAARLGRLTGSCAGDMLAEVKNGEAAARRNLRLRLVLERITGKSQESDYVSPAMQAGIDREAGAFAAYEALTGEMVERVGFVQHDSLMAGCSPDGWLHGGSVLLSIKCRQPAAHLEAVRYGTIPRDALTQIHHEMWITGAQAADYFSWNPDFPEPLQSRIVGVIRDEMAIAKYAAKAIAFLAEVDAECEAVRTITNPGAVLRDALAGVR